MTYLITLLVLGTLITVHELGHYVFARRAGIVPSAFSIGFGKVLIKKKWKGTEWRLSLLPLGGYVEIPGMGGDEASSEYKGKVFDQVPYLHKMAILFGGSLFNILFYVVSIIVAGFLIAGFNLKVLFLPFAFIVKGYQTLVSKPDLASEIAYKASTGVGTSYSEAFSSLGDSLIAQPFAVDLVIIGVVSLLLGITNLLPIPMLDGGQMVITTGEKITGRKFRGLFADIITTVSVIYLIYLMLIPALNDIWSLISTWW